MTATDDARLPPGIRKLLADHNLTAADVPVSGDRLSREDILAEAQRRAGRPASGVTRIPHDSIRKRIAEHLAQSVRTAPHVTAMFEADFTAISAHRAAHKAEFEESGREPDVHGLFRGGVRGGDEGRTGGERALV